MSQLLLLPRGVGGGGLTVPHPRGLLSLPSQSLTSGGPSRWNLVSQPGKLRLGEASKQQNRGTSSTRVTG